MVRSLYIAFYAHPLPLPCFLSQIVLLPPCSAPPSHDPSSSPVPPLLWCPTAPPEVSLSGQAAPGCNVGEGREEGGEQGQGATQQCAQAVVHVPAALMTSVAGTGGLQGQGHEGGGAEVQDEGSHSPEGLLVCSLGLSQLGQGQEQGGGVRDAGSLVLQAMLVVLPPAWRVVASSQYQKEQVLLLVHELGPSVQGLGQQGQGQLGAVAAHLVAVPLPILALLEGWQEQGASVLQV